MAYRQVVGEENEIDWSACPWWHCRRTSPPFGILHLLKLPSILNALAVVWFARLHAAVRRSSTSTSDLGSERVTTLSPG